MKKYFLGKKKAKKRWVYLNFLQIYDFLHCVQILESFEYIYKDEEESTTSTKNIEISNKEQKTNDEV